MAIVIRTSDNRTLPLSADLMRIGSSERSAIRFAVGEVAPEHAEIQKIGGRWLIRSVCDERIQIEGQSPARLVWMKPGDRILISSSGVWFIFDPSAPAQKTDVAAVAGGKADQTSIPVDSNRPNTSTPLTKQGSTGVRNSVIIASVCIIAIFAFLWVRQLNKPDADLPLAENEETEGPETVPLPPEDRPLIHTEQRRLLIGYEVAEQRMLLGQCWAIDTKTIASSAVLLAELQKAGTQISVFIHTGTPGSGVTYVDVNAITFPPGFDMEDAGTMHSAVAIATLQDELQSIPPLSDATECVPESDVLEGQVVTQFGFAVPLEAAAATKFDLTTPPSPQVHVGQINYAGNESPRTIKVKFSDWRSADVILEGSLVHDESGRVLGTLASGDQESQEFYLIHTDRLMELQQ